MRTKPVSLLIVFAILIIALTQLHNVSAADHPGWVSVNVLSFDGTKITATIVIRVVGDHQNATVRILGEDYPGVSIGRIVRQVSYSTDTNMTTFEYTQSFSSPQNYNVTPGLYGVAVFPIDEHNFRFRITTDFDANIDTRPTTPNLPNGNYEGFLKEIGTSRNDGYTYAFLLTLTHSWSFVWSMIFWTWGVVAILIVATSGLILGLLRRHASQANIVTVASSLVVFVPVYELALQTYKSPLGMTLSDICVFALLVIDVLVLVWTILRRSANDPNGNPPVKPPKVERPIRAKTIIAFLSTSLVAIGLLLISAYWLGWVSALPLVSEWGFTMISLGGGVAITYLVIDQLLLSDERKSWKAVEEQANELIETELEEVFLYLGFMTGIFDSLAPGEHKEKELLEGMRKLADPANISLLQNNLTKLKIFEAAEVPPLVNSLSESAKRLGELQMRYSYKFLDPQLVRLVVDVENHLRHLEILIFQLRRVLVGAKISDTSTLETSISKTDFQPLLKSFVDAVDNGVFELQPLSKG